MNYFRNILLLLLGIMTLLSSCKKDEKPDKYPDNDVPLIKTEDHEQFYEYFYDDLGRIIRSDQNGFTIRTYVYHDDSVDVNNSTETFMRLHLNNRGLVDKEVFLTSGDTIHYTFDDGGYLIAHGNRTYTIEDGNTTEIYEHGNLVATTEYDPETVNTIDHANKGMPYLGKTSKNLPIAGIGHHGNSQIIFDIQYEFDDQERVIKQIFKSDSLVENILIFTYW